MPTYEYECQGCGHKFEKFQYMTEAPIKKCPKCNEDKAKRLISSGAGIIFKGSGFYATDYRKDKRKPGSNCPMAKDDKPDCSSCQGHK
jgi:putative FmdB family regulatory protein